MAIISFTFFTYLDLKFKEIFLFFFNFDTQQLSLYLLLKQIGLFYFDSSQMLSDTQHFWQLFILVFSLFKLKV